MNQLALFADPTPTPRAVIDDGWTRAMREPVQSELAARLNDRPGEWLDLCDFRDIQEHHRIGFGMGHALAKLVRDGRAIEKNIYFGTESPCHPGEYKGYTTVYSTFTHGPAPETTITTKKPWLKTLLLNGPTILSTPGKAARKSARVATTATPRRGTRVSPAARP
nr:hypothetical protein [Massilia sp. PDC64]